MKRRYIVMLIAALVVIDQVLKFYIKTNFALHDSVHVWGNWFQIYFLENEGAAWGMKLSGQYGKLILSLFRIAAVVAIGFGIGYMYRRPTSTSMLVVAAMVMAGALGNTIDCVAYGQIFSASTVDSVATLGGSYAPWLYGKVVDMFYFPIITITDVPSWLGWLAGADGVFTFFAPVFNLADSYISLAVIYVLIFERKFFK